MRFSSSSGPHIVGRGLTASAGSSLWTPARLANKLLWVRGDLVVTTSGRVTQWTDQSGNGNHLTPLGGSSTQPAPATWAAGNGTSAVLFDGGDRLATVGNILPTADGAAFTLYFAGSFDDTLFRCAVLTNGTGGGVALTQNGGGTGNIQRWKLGVTFDEDGAAVTTPLNAIMLDKVGASPGSTMYVNGALVTTTSPDASVGVPSGRLYVGASATTNFYKGYVEELIVQLGHPTLDDLAFYNAYSLRRRGV